MNCPKCGSEATGNFCQNCGAKLNDDAPANKLSAKVTPQKQFMPAFVADLIAKFPQINVFGIVAFALSIFTVIFSGENVFLVLFLVVLTTAFIVLSFWEVQQKSVSIGFTVAAIAFVCIGLVSGIVTATKASKPAVDGTVVAAGIETPVLSARPTATASEAPSATPIVTPEPTATPEPTPSPTPDVFTVRYSDGQYKVGSDIAAGEYIAFSDGWMGYICVSSDANKDDIIYNDTFETNTVFTVYDGEYLELSSCIAYIADEFYSAYTVRIDQDGIMLKVGHDIAAGEYKLETDEDDFGYYCIYNDSRHAKIVKNNVFEGSSYVTVKDGQYLVLSGCFIIDADLAAVPSSDVDSSASATAAPSSATTSAPTATPHATTPTPAITPAVAPTAAPTPNPTADGYVLP